MGLKQVLYLKVCLNQQISVDGHNMGTGKYFPWTSPFQWKCQCPQHLYIHRMMRHKECTTWDVNLDVSHALFWTIFVAFIDQKLPFWPPGRQFFLCQIIAEHPILPNFHVLTIPVAFEKKTLFFPFFLNIQDGQYFHLHEKT